MAFENLSSRLQMALRRVTGRGKLTRKRYWWDVARD